MDRLPVVKEFVEEKVEEKEDIMDLEEKDMEIDNSISANDNFEEEKKEEEEEIEIKEKYKVPQEEVFGSVSKSATPEIKKVKKPKRQITEEHRQRLAKGREKALANRRAKAKAKKDSTSANKKVEFKNEKEEISIPPELKEELKQSATENIRDKTLTRKDIEEISANTSKKVLEDYEILRKQRKAEKKKKQEVENHRSIVREKIQKATARDTTFDFCFA